MNVDTLMPTERFRIVTQTITLYANKKKTTLATEKIGSIGWQDLGVGKWKEWIWVRTVGASAEAWVPIQLHRKNLFDRKAQNRLFYKVNPHLREKIILAKRRSRKNEYPHSLRL